MLALQKCCRYHTVQGIRKRIWGGVMLPTAPQTRIPAAGAHVAWGLELQNSLHRAERSSQVKMQSCFPATRSTIIQQRLSTFLLSLKSGFKESLKGKGWVCIVRQATNSAIVSNQTLKYQFHLSKRWLVGKQWALCIHLPSSHR